MSKLARDFGGVIDNARPQEKVEGGMVEGGGGVGDSGNGLVLGGSGTIEASGTNESTSVIARKRVVRSCGSHGGGCGGRGGNEGKAMHGGGSGHGCTSNKITIGDGDTPAFDSFWGNNDE